MAVCGGSANRPCTITHPKVADAAVFGVPNAEMGEEVKAVVQPLAGVAHTPELAAAALSATLGCAATEIVVADALQGSPWLDVA